MWIHPPHARYPFFAAAREAVESADVAIAALVTESVPAIEHGVKRVERVLMEDTVEPDPGEAYPREAKTELLSYPISCIIVLLVETPAAVDKCAHAEVNMSYERMLAGFDAGDDDVHGEVRTSLDDSPREFNLDGVVWAESNRNRSGRCVPDNY